jgi:lysozyme
MALPLVSIFEGCEKRRADKIYPYLDTVAKPPRWTRGCGRTYGITENSEAITPEQAKTELADGLAAYAKQCLIYSPTLAQRPACLAAVVSWTWNCGAGAFKASRLRRAINAGKWEDAAELIKTPRTAGGVEVGGLVRRRNAEAALFRMGI